MKTVTLTSSDKKIDLLLKVAKEMGVAAKVVEGDDIALPGPNLTNKQLDALLKSGDGEGGYTSKGVLELIQRKSRKK